MNIPIPDDLSETASSLSTKENSSEQESGIEIIEIEKLAPPPPSSPTPPLKLSLIELVISFVINGKEAGERCLEVDLNENFEHFQSRLSTLILIKLPKHPGFHEVSYKRAYVTKAQERKRKDLPWKDFIDEDDYSGMVNSIRSSEPSKMALIVRAFITIEKEDFEAQIEPVIASQRVVLYSLVLKLTADCYFSAEGGFGGTPARSAYSTFSSSSNSMEM